MRSDKPDWYSRLEKGPAGRTVFDEEMMRKVEEKVRELRKRPAGHGRRFLWAAGVAAMICLTAGAGVFYGMNTRSSGPSDASPGVTAAPSEGLNTNVPSPTPAADPAASLKLWEGIHALSMTDSQNGWALTKTAVLKTTDGGQHWLDVTDAGMQANEGLAKAVGAYQNANIAVIAVPGSKGGTVNVFATRNGGKTWEQTSITSERFNDIPPYIQSINFPDAMHGYILATFGAAMGSVTASVFKTTDGGNTWTIASETDPTNAAKGGLPFSGNKSGITFIDAKNGWLTGNWPGDSIYLFTTHDGGMTWEPQTVAVPKGASAEGGAGFSFPSVFTDAQNGVMPVRLGPDRLIWFYRTKDGGNTWSAQQSITTDEQPVYSFSREGSGVVFTGQQSWWSAEGGNFVKSGQLSSKGVPTAVAAANDRTAYAAGTDFLAQTTDQGRTWSWIVPIVEK